MSIQQIDDTPLILIVAGQSNGVGVDKLLASDFVVNNLSEYVREYGSWISSATHYSYGDSIVWYGVPCAYNLLDKFPNKLIYTIGVGVSGTPITKRNYVEGDKTWSSIGYLRSQAKQKIESVLNRLPKYKVLGTLWLQGEAEVAAMVSALRSGSNDFIEDLRFSIKDIAEWFIGSFGGHFFASKISYWDYGGNVDYSEYDNAVDRVNELYLQVLDTVSNAHLATGITKLFYGKQDLWRDYIHYSQRGYDLVGYEFANYLKPFVAGQISDKKVNPNTQKIDSLVTNCTGIAEEVSSLLTGEELTDSQKLLMKDRIYSNLGLI